MPVRTGDLDAVSEEGFDRLRRTRSGHGVDPMLEGRLKRLGVGETVRVPVESDQAVRGW